MANGAGYRLSVDSETMLTRPRSCIDAQAFRVKDFLCCRHNLVYSNQTCRRGICVTAHLHRLHLGDFLDNRLVRISNLVDIYIAFVGYLG
ncbi:hypothetical protein [Mycobacterium sp. 050134]|uniref:hypothetical protein n=1 Tax=Mycobacterium sp. 050134 TaxID=3096111 RepID=UPI002EDA2DC9